MHLPEEKDTEQEITEQMRGVDYLHKKIEENKIYEFTMEELQELKNARNNSRTSQKAQECLDHHQKQKASGLIGLMRRDDVHPQLYAKEILGTSAKMVVEEAEREWTGPNRRNPLRRYFTWLWKLSKDSGFQVNVQEFARKYFNAELIKRMPDSTTKNMVNYLILWEQNKLNKEHQAVWGEFTEQSQKKSGEEKPLTDIQKIHHVLNIEGNINTLEWEALIALPFAESSRKLDSAQLKKFLTLLGKPIPGKQGKAQEFIQSQITPDALTSLREKHGHELEEMAERVLRISRKDFLEEPLEVGDEVTKNAMAKGAMLEEGEREKSDIYDSEQMDTKKIENNLEKMASIIEKAEFGEHVMNTVKQALLEQKQEMEMSESGQVNKQNERNRTETVLFAVQNHIKEEIEEGIKMSAQEMKKRIIRLKIQTKPFIDAINQTMAESYAQGEHREKTAHEAQKFVDVRTEALFQRAEMFCDLAISDDSKEEILQKLHDMDIRETDEDAEPENSKKVISALLQYTKEIDNETGSVKAKEQENKEYLRETLQKYFVMDSKKRFDAVLGEIDEIVEKSKVEAEHIQEALQNGELPEMHCYGVIQQWAQKHSIPFTEATEIIRTLAPSAQIIFLGKKEFLEKALLSSFSEEETQELLQWYEKSPQNFARKFINSGNLKQSLLESARDDVLSASNFVMDAYSDKELSSGITPKEMKEKYKESLESAEPMRIALEPHAEKAKKISEELKLFRKSIPEENDLIDARDELFRLEKVLEAIGCYSEPAGKYKEVSPLDSNKFLEDLSRLTDKKEEILSQSTPQELTAECEKVLSSTEERLNSLRKLSAEGQIEVLRRPVTDLFKSGTKLREKQESGEQKRKEKLQQFADWVVSEKKLDDTIRSLIESLENLDGKKVLVKKSDEEFKKQHGEKTKAVVVLQNGSFEIHVRERDWDSKNAELETSLRHEGFHAMDAANKKAFSKELNTKVKEALGKEYENFKARFCSATGTQESEFTDELFAYFMAGDSQEIKNIINEIPEEIRSEFSNKKETYAQDFAEKGIRVGFFVRTEKHHRNTASEITFDHNTKQHWQFEIKTKIQRLQNSIDSIRKSTVHMKGKELLISHLEHGLQDFIEKAKKPIEKDDEFEELMCHIYDTEKGGLIQLAESKIVTLAENQEPEKGFFKEVWDNTTFLSLADMGTMFHVGKEFIERRHQRNSKLRSGQAGKAIFEKIVPQLANEYDNKAEEAEKEEVGNYENGLDNKDGWEIMERLSETNNKDELKACLNVLSKHGQIDWYDRRIWEALERAGSGIKILEADVNDMRSLKTKLERACSILWDSDYFLNTDRANGSGYEHEKKEYDNETAANIQGLEAMLQSLLHQKKHGHDVEPQRFEAYLEKCIDAGKSNPESIFWYLLQGVHFGILNMERVNYLDYAKLNAFPPIQWFYEKRPKLDEVRSIAEMFPPGEENPPPAFYDWFMSTVMSNKNVLERVVKNAITARESWDHDWAGTIFSIGDTDSAWQIMAKDHEKPTMHLTAYPNMTVGQLTYITNLARYKNRYSDKHLKDEIVRHLGFSAVVSSALQGNVRSDKIYNLGQDQLGKPARISSKDGIYHSDEHLTTKEILESSESILIALDPEIFGYFIGKDFSNQQKVKDIVRHINSTEGYEGILDSERIENGKDMLSALPAVIERAIEKKGGIDRVIHQAREVYAKHHKEDSDNKYGLNRIKDERGINWREHAEKTVGHQILNNFGMYNRHK